MGLRLLVFVVLLAVSLEYINNAAPRAHAMAIPEKQDMMHRFAEFLHQDKEFSDMLNQKFEPIRNKREAAGEMESDSDDFDDARKQPGFFDRAAKFVTELLQRFLKWVNNSDQN